MKWVVRRFYLFGVIAVFFTDIYTTQNEVVVHTQEKEEVEEKFREEKNEQIDGYTNQIMCDENDEEVCEYIEEQHKESRLKIWFNNMAIIAMLKFLQFKDCLDSCKDTLDTWIRKMLCPIQKKLAR